MHSVDRLLEDVPMTGALFSRTQEYAARRRGEPYDRYTYAAEVTVHLSSLPCWKHLSPDQRKVGVASLVKDMQEEAAAERKAYIVPPYPNAVSVVCSSNQSGYAHHHGR